MAKTDPASSTTTFQGFTSPNTTPVPDELFDELLARLSGAELKVLLYIVRRTFGFKKQSDTISLSQICRGIVTRDGRVIDHGTGLSKDSVTRALASLEEQRLIVRNRARSLERGDEPTTYTLNILTPVSDFRTRGGAKIGHPPVRFSDTQQTVLQETERQQQGTPVPSASEVDAQPEGSDVVDPSLDGVESITTPPGEGSAESPDHLKAELMKRGVGVGTAAVLVRDPGTRRLIPEKLRLFDWAKQHRPGLITKSDGGWLRMAITTNYPLPADFTAQGEEEKRRREQAERKEQRRRAELEQMAQQYVTTPAAFAEEKLRINDRLQDGRRRPRLVGEEREAFRREQAALHTAAAIEWFATYWECAQLKPDWLTALPDDEGVAPEPSQKALERVLRGSNGSVRSVGQVLAERPVTAQIRGPQGTPAKARG